MEYAKYFAKKMRISQGYNDGNHKLHSGGNIKDYPVDETYGDSKRDGYFLAPCEMKIVRMYGPAVGNKSVTNNIWITSTCKVKMPCGEDYLTIFVGHISNDDMKKMKVGKVYKQGEKICLEYKDANSTGNHHHVAFGKGKISGTGWRENNKKVWVLTTTGGTIKPEQALYVDPKQTTVIDSKKIKFQEIPKEIDVWTKGTYKLLVAKYLRKTHDLGNNLVKVKECTVAMRKALTSTKDNDNAKIQAGREITITQIYTEKNGRVWGKNYSGWVVLCNADGTKQATKTS